MDAENKYEETPCEEKETSVDQTDSNPLIDGRKSDEQAPEEPHSDGPFKADHLRRKAFALEQRFREHGLAATRRSKSLWISSIAEEFLELMAAQLATSKTEVLEQAIMAFYVTAFSTERRAVADLVLLLDNLALLVNEQTQELLNLETLAAASLAEDASHLEAESTSPENGGKDEH